MVFAVVKPGPWAARLALLAALLAGCASPPAPAAVTETPASATAAPTLAAPDATKIATEDNIAIEFADKIALLQPGPGSQLVSPIEILLAFPYSGAVRVELHRADGRLIARQLVAPQEAGALQLAMPFEVNRTQPGLLSLNEQDEFDRIVRLISVDILLQSEGDVLIQPAEDDRGLHILTPDEGGPASRPLAVRGRLQPPAAGPVQMRLLNRENRIVASADKYAGADGLFEFELDYAPREAGWFLLTVSQQQQGVLTALDSVEIWLEP